MKALIQRVSRASVSVNSTTIASIQAGLLVFLGIGRQDNETSIPVLADKVAGLRIFEDAAGKLNRSVRDIGGEILVVSQFTLYADCATGRRPSFLEAAAPEMAEAYYERFIAALSDTGLTVRSGRFRATMQIELVNDGPATFLLESDSLR